MFTPKTRLIVISICLVLAGISVYQDKTLAAVLALSFIGWTVFGFIRQGTVYLAFRKLKTGDHLAAGEYLKMTKKVNWLSSFQRSHYYFVKGYIDMAKGNLEEAKTGFEKALENGLKLKNDIALAYANLASLNHRQKNRVQAKEYIKKALSLRVKKNVRQEIERLASQIG